MVLAVYMTGVPTGLYITTPPPQKKKMSLKFYSQKILGIKIFFPRKTRLKYFNDNLFSQTDFKKYVTDLFTPKILRV